MNLCQGLSQQRPDEAVTAVRQDDDQRPEDSELASRVGQQTQAAEVHLCYLARRPRRHAHRAPRCLAETGTTHKAAQRSVGNSNSLLQEQFVHPRELQPLLAKPGCQALPLSFQQNNQR